MHLHPHIQIPNAFPASCVQENYKFSTCCVCTSIVFFFCHSEQFVYTTCTDLLLFIYWTCSNSIKKSVVIFWVNWCENECFWQRFTCNSIWSGWNRSHFDHNKWLTSPGMISYTDFLNPVSIFCMKDWEFVGLSFIFIQLLYFQWDRFLAVNALIVGSSPGLFSRVCFFVLYKRRNFLRKFGKVWKKFISHYGFLRAGQDRAKIWLYWLSHFAVT